MRTPPEITLNTPIGADVDLNVDDIRLADGTRLTNKLAETITREALSARPADQQMTDDQAADYYETANNGDGPDIVTEIDPAELVERIAVRQAARAAETHLGLAIAAASGNGPTGPQSALFSGKPGKSPTPNMQPDVMPNLRTMGLDVTATTSGDTTKTLTKDQTGLGAVTPETHPGRDATHFRRIVKAKSAITEAEQELRAAVAAARQAGDSWTVIGAALGISRQAAQQRFSRHDQTN